MGQCWDLPKNKVEPPGFGFNPTNEVLIKEYLMPKITGTAVPHDVDFIIATIDDLCQLDPSELPSLCSKPWDSKAYCYFFHKWNPYGKGTRFDRKMKGGGFWKKTGTPLKIFDSETKTAIGKRSILVFHHKGGAKTDYKIHTYEIVDPSSHSRVAPYVVCRLEKPAMKTGKTEKMSVGTTCTETQPVDDDTKSGIESAATEYGGESSANITCNDDIPVVATTTTITTETQPVDNKAIAGTQSLPCQPLSPSHGLGEQDESVLEMLKFFFVPSGGSTQTMDTIYNESYEPVSTNTPIVSRNTDGDDGVNG